VAQRPVIEAVEAGLVDVDHAQAQTGAGLVQRERARAAVRRRHRHRREGRGQRAPRHFYAAADRRGAQRLLLEVGLLHQPVCDSPHQLGLRPAAVDAAVPQPQVIRQELRHPAFADPVAHHQRLVVGAAEDGVAALAARGDDAEPAARGKRRLYPGRQEASA